MIMRLALNKRLRVGSFDDGRNEEIGNAVGRNPIPIFIPCHRVIGANGALTGFSGGLAIKEKLLQIERIRPRLLFDVF